MSGRRRWRFRPRHRRRRRFHGYFVINGYIAVKRSNGCFVTKWQLGLGALDAGQGWVLLVLLGSSVLNAAFLTLALVLGEFTFANILGFETFPTWILRISGSAPQLSVAVSVLSLVRMVAFACAELGMTRWARPAKSGVHVARPDPSRSLRAAAALTAEASRTASERRVEEHGRLPGTHHLMRTRPF